MGSLDCVPAMHITLHIGGRRPQSPGITVNNNTEAIKYRASRTVDNSFLMCYNIQEVLPPRGGSETRNVRALFPVIPILQVVTAAQNSAESRTRSNYSRILKVCICFAYCYTPQANIGDSENGNMCSDIVGFSLQRSLFWSGGGM